MCANNMPMLTWHLRTLADQIEFDHIYMLINLKPAKLCPVNQPKTIILSPNQSPITQAPPLLCKSIVIIPTE